MKMTIYIGIVIALFLLFFIAVYKVWDMFAAFDEKLNNKKFSQKEQVKPQANKQTTQGNKAQGGHAYQGGQNNYQNNGNNGFYNQSQYKQQNRTNADDSPKKQLPDCLVVLGFTKIPEDKNLIKARYWKLSKIYHPDMGGTQEEFERINKAWDEARKIYELK